MNDRSVLSSYMNDMRAALLCGCLLLVCVMLTGCSEDTAEPTTVTARYPEAVRSSGGMISSASKEATDVGVEVLRNGGNAVDAAVSVGFALAVTLPQAGNLGGGGFMVIRMADGQTTAIDFRERAPSAATRNMYLDASGNVVPERSRTGALAVGVPGTPAGLLMALETYGSGTMSPRKVIEPAIALAEDGFVVHEQLAADFESARATMEQFESTREIFMPNRTLPQAGTVWKQPELAATLRRIAEEGRNGFYRGRTADLVAAEMKRSGGLITTEDLDEYQPVERVPIIGTYRNHTIISMPPPSSGGVLLVQMLNMMEPYDFSTIPHHSAQHAHLLAEIMRRAYADRAMHLGDADYYDVPVDALIDRRYAEARRSTITDVATPSDSLTHGDPGIIMHESDQTTHYSVVDAAGNCVSVTVTLNSSFGSKLTVGGAGFLLNNEMDDFSASPGTPNLYGLVGGEANSIEPGKRMLSSMTPTIVLRDGEPWLVVGTPGGSTIITTVLQVIHNQIDYDMGLVEAIETERIHHQWRPDTLFYEAGAFTLGALDSLRKMGHHPVERTERSGRVDAVRIEHEDGKRVVLGWSDRRGYGSAAGDMPE
jgi:gamma-glutamyltranspeptidase/glutathione hydrolase